MSTVDKKLREAHFFLRKMKEREALAFGDHEEFDFLLSAFLNAGRSLDYRLRHTSNRYAPFRVTWDAQLTAEEDELIRFLVDDRNLEVHEAGSTRQQAEVRIPVRGTYQDPSGTLTVFAAVGTPPAELIKPTYYFDIGGRRVPVLAACDAYIQLLERLVADCHAAGIA